MMQSMELQRVRHDLVTEQQRIKEYVILRLPSRSKASFMAQTVKNLQEVKVQSLGQEDCLEMGMVTHSSILAWSIPWTEEPGGLQSMVLLSRTWLSG